MKPTSPSITATALALALALVACEKKSDPPPTNPEPSPPVAETPTQAEEPEAEPEPEPEPATPPPPVEEGPERPPEPQIGGKAAKGTGMMIAGGTLLGVGAGALTASVLLTQCPEPANTVGCKYAPHRTFVVPVSAAVTTAGLLLLLVGAGYSTRYKRWKAWSPEKERAKVKTAAVGPTLIPGGGGIGYVGRF